MKIAIVLGTRPEIIKLSQIIKECKKRKLEFLIIHTNQHYSKEMSDVFFEDLGLDKPLYNLNIGSGSHGEQIGKMIIELEKLFKTIKPDIVVVQGDTNSVFSAGFIASRLGIKIAHVEAGLRSYDRTMPEEINRILIDHISDFLFVPTKNAEKTALKEGIDKEKIFITGNTIVDAVLENVEIAESKSDIMNKLNIEPGRFILLTLHRPSNVDDERNLREIISGLNEVYKIFNLEIIWPIHPRTKNKISEFGINVEKGIRTITPLDFFDFLLLEKNAKIVMTDSGGVQEECCILKTRCITLRENTERPETIDVGSNILVGRSTDKIIQSIKEMSNKETNWINPFGDGKSSIKIIDILIDKVK